MSILVVGSTGQVGSRILQELGGSRAEVVALTHRKPAKDLPANARVTRGNLLNVDFLQEVLAGVDTVFLMNPVVPDELFRALIALDACRRANIRGLVYLSMVNSDRFVDVPHAAAKFAVERAISDRGMAATVLRPNYFMQNDLAQREGITGKGIYASPIGSLGLPMVDMRDIAAIAAAELLRRDESETSLPAETIEVSGPDVMTGEEVAKVWSEVLDRSIAYGGDDLDSLERTYRTMGTSAAARDVALMFKGFLTDGMVADPDAAQKLAARLGRPLRDYRSFATEAAADWGKPKPLLERVADALLPGDHQ
ncbi:MAG: NmrA family NAD(P)-binding protein [Xanthobacteraceae bacterium]|nr:NmrA family NAD(P)-binding protein [Xanthobacteraceae bacterium]